jgi:H+/Cl- antiporter ClcA
VAAAAEPIDPGALIRSRDYVRLLVLAAVVGIVVSIAGWLFLEATVAIQHWVYEDLPAAVGAEPLPLWWPLPFLAIAGLITAVAIDRLPGHGGHRPAAGLAGGGGPTLPAELPGVILAAVASIGLGVVLGPEAPLIALGGGLALLTITLLRREVPDQAKLVIAAAGSFAAISTIFGNPVIGAVIIIEAAGLGGATLPLVLLPGLLAAGIGSIVFLGMGKLSGLDSSAYALGPLDLPPAPPLTIADFVLAIALAVVAAIVVRAILEVAWSVESVVLRRPLLLLPVAGLVIGALAIVFGQLTGQPLQLVLLSGQDAMGPMVSSAPALPAATLAALFLFKGLAWSVSLGGFRGGPTFPAMFLGMVAGLLVAAVLGVAQTPAISIAMAAMTVSTLRLPLASVVLAMVVTQAGLTVAPLIIVAVVVAYIVTQLIGARRGAAPEGDRAPRQRSATARLGPTRVQSDR